MRAQSAHSRSLKPKPPNIDSDTISIHSTADGDASPSIVRTSKLKGNQFGLLEEPKLVAYQSHEVALVGLQVALWYADSLRASRRSTNVKDIEPLFYIAKSILIVPQDTVRNIKTYSSFNYLDCDTIGSPFFGSLRY